MCIHYCDHGGDCGGGHGGLSVGSLHDAVTLWVGGSVHKGLDISFTMEILFDGLGVMGRLLWAIGLVRLTMVYHDGCKSIRDKPNIKGVLIVASGIFLDTLSLTVSF